MIFGKTSFWLYFAIMFEIPIRKPLSIKINQYKLFKTIIIFRIIM